MARHGTQAPQWLPSKCIHKIHVLPICQVQKGLILEANVVGSRGDLGLTGVLLHVPPVYEEHDADADGDADDDGDFGGDVTWCVLGTEGLRSYKEVMLDIGPYLETY